MKKKLLAFLFVAVMAVTVFAVQSFAAEGTIGDCTYVYEDGVLTISGEGALPNGVFQAGKSATTVIIEEGITNIPDNFFNMYRNLETLYIPTSVTSIGERALAYTSKLTSVVIPENSNLTTIAKQAFRYSGIAQLDFTNSKLSTIGLEAFKECKKLSVVDLGDDITSMEAAIFRYCESLTTVTIEGSYTTIPNYAFQGTTSLKNVNLSDTFTTFGTYVFHSSGITTYNIPSNVTKIGVGAFAYSGLTTITIPSTVTSLGDNVFDHCASLKTATIETYNSGAIPQRAFYYCTALETVSYPNSIINIKPYAFYNCSSLKTIQIPTRYIQNKAFYGCTSLSIDVVIPSTVTRFYEGAFANSGVVGATIETSKMIPNEAFFNCKNLSKVTISATCEGIGIQAFDGCSALVGNIEIPGTVTTISAYAFRGTGITGITLNEGVVVIGDSSFMNCKGLTTIVLPTTCTTVENNAFNGSGLTSAYFPKSVTSIASRYIFRNCGDLVLYTEEDATYVIDFYNSNASKMTHVTLNTSYNPGGEDHECVFGEWVETTAPTADAAGLLTKTCECEATETYELPALNKTDYTYTETPATCAAVGTGFYAITVDGQTFTYTVELPMLDHEFGDWVVTTPATPLDDGVKTKECECGETATEAVPYEGQAAALDVVVDGTNVTATLKIVGAPDLTSIGFSIAYADKLNLTAAESLLEGNTTDSNTANNPVKFVWINGLANEDVNGDVLVLTFEIAEDVAVSAEDFTITYDADDVCVIGEDKALVNVELETFVKVS